MLLQRIDQKYFICGLYNSLIMENTVSKKREEQKLNRKINSITSTKRDPLIALWRIFEKN